VLLGAGSAGVGYYLAAVFDVAIAGMMAVVAGGFFVLALLISPSRGLVADLLRRRRNRRYFARDLLISKLAELGERTTEEELVRYLSWGCSDFSRVLRDAMRSGLVLRPAAQEVALTDKGREAACETAVTCA
jgi:manganese/zinc/iron transport system permease protein